MKKVAGIFTFALLMFALATNANALTVQQSLFTGETNWLSDNSAFYLINADGSTLDNQTVLGTPDDSIIVVGDRIRGMFEIATVEDGTGGGGTNYLGGTTGNNEFTGLYEVEVLSKTADSAGNWTFTMGPSASFQIEMEGYLGLAAGSLPNVAVSMWQDSLINYTRLSGDDIGGGYVANPFVVSEELLIDNAQDGSYFWSLGFANSAPNNYWVIKTSDDNIWNLKTGLPAAANYGTVNLALDLVDNQSGVPLEKHTTIGGGLADLTGSGNMLTVGGMGTPFDGYDNFDLTINPIPEPATMLLLGSGLIGLSGFGRRKFNRKNKK